MLRVTIKLTHKVKDSRTLKWFGFVLFKQLLNIRGILPHFLRKFGQRAKYF